MPRRETNGLVIVVGGMIGGVPDQGGATWAVLQYLLGLRRLGHDVYFVESVSSSHNSPTGAPLSRSHNASYIADVLSDYGMGHRWSLLQRGTSQTAGLPYDQLMRVAHQAHLLINLGGSLRDSDVIDPIPVRLYVDLDPGFTQVWHEIDGLDMGFDRHTHFATVGGSVGDPDCPVPTCGRRWITTVPPVVLQQWQRQPARGGPITTVANWRSYGTVQYRGETWGQKAHSWRQILTLPAQSQERFEVALAIDPGDDTDRRALNAHGWKLHDPAHVAPTPAKYRNFISRSKAELCVAKSGYVESRCGWLSDRTVCYLASGRPVVAQDTGFRFPAGFGLLPFSSVEDAVSALASIEADYDSHASAARALAEDLFDSDKILDGLIEQVMT